MSSESAALWIEVLSRHDEVLARYRVDCRHDGEVFIGRGYDNDVILDDPYVAARHVRIVRGERGALIAEDLGSANGLFAGDERRRVAQVALDATGTFRIGRTRLRIRQPDDAVAPERVSRPGMRMWPLALGLGGVLLGTELLTSWLEATSEQKLIDYLGPLVVTCLLVGLWAATWAILSRVFSGRARFERHLLIAVCGLLAVSLLSELTSYGAFALSQGGLVDYRYIAMWLLAAAVCFLHLREVGPARGIGHPRLRLKAAAVAALALVAISMQTLWQRELAAATDQQTFLGDLKPPMLRLATPQTEPAFFAGVDSLKAQLDRARSEPPGRSWEFMGSDDD